MHCCSPAFSIGAFSVLRGWHGLEAESCLYWVLARWGGTTEHIDVAVETAVEVRTDTAYIIGIGLARGQ